MCFLKSCAVENMCKTFFKATFNGLKKSKKIRYNGFNYMHYAYLIIGIERLNNLKNIVKKGSYNSYIRFNSSPLKKLRHYMSQWINVKVGLVRGKDDSNYYQPCSITLPQCISCSSTY